MTARVITQIAVLPGTAANTAQTLYALADDGTVWRLQIGSGKPWQPLLPLPEKLPGKP